jgi:hypothetical protein
MNPAIVLLLCATSLSLPAAYGPNGAIPEQARPSVSIRLDINAPQPLAEAIRLHMAQAFGPYAAVRLVEQNPQWTIKFVTQALLDDEGNTTAIGLSVVVLKHGPQMNMLSTLAQAWRYIINAGLLQRDQPLEVGMRQLVAAIEGLPKTDDLAVLSQHLMCVIPADRLSDACRDIVADFNARVFAAKPNTFGSAGDR